MNILRVIATMDPSNGGPSQGIRNSSPKVQACGHVDEVVCLDDSRAAYLRDQLIHTHALGPGRGPWAYNPRLAIWLEHNLPRFDVVVLHGLWLYPSVAVARAARVAKTPFVVFPHGMLDPWFQRAPGRRLKAIRNWVYWKLVEHRIVNNAKALLFTSEEERVRARETFRPYAPRGEITVGYGVPQPPAKSPLMMDSFANSCGSLPLARPYILFLGRVHPKKGLDLAIRAYSKIKSAHLGNQQMPALVIAGPGSNDSYGKAMRRLADEVRCGSDIVFTGLLQGDAKWGAYYGCEAFILPSHQENFGIAVVEAMACGKPVLISDKVNIWREIEADGAGMIGADDLDGTAGLLGRWVACSTDTRLKMGQCAGRAFLDRFEITRAARSLISALEAVRQK